MPRFRYVIALGLAVLLLVFALVFSILGRVRYGDFYETAEVMSIIENNYVDKVDIKKCQEKILQSGLQDCLDKHSYYYSADDLKAVKSLDSAPFVGIGLQVNKKDDYIHVVSVLENSPAQRVGIIPDDLIVAVNGVSTKNMSPEDATNKIRGKSGEKVVLTIQRGQKKQKDFILVREKIERFYVKPSFITPEIGYIRITSFEQLSSLELYSSFYSLGILSDFSSKDFTGNKSARGIIIDLRRNPGGFLGEVLSMLDFFSPDKGRTVFSAKGLHVNEKFTTGIKGFFDNLPIVVLIDANSASAAEVMAGVLKIWGHAVVGEKSYGKGTVQEFPIRLSSGSALRLTVARYFLGEQEVAVDGIGISPDHEVKWKKSENQSEEDFAAEFFPNFGNPEKDPQLKKAVEVLKEQMKKPRN
ncbi:MAG: Carboxy-terminal processing protease [Parcubacteria group bacterium GW2011_GWA2_42_14]|nr:MAG: Carboxy-terminal processing protease [Parcubacteria group bacterium GW2011_GWA2_42_14]